MGLFDFLTGGDPETARRRAESERRREEIVHGLRQGRVPASIEARLGGARAGRLPWVATLSPAELRLARSHGIRPVCSVSSTCWMHVGWSWTEGHGEGWRTALARLRAEAACAGANAVLDVRLRTIPLAIPDSMDFSLVGTAVRVDGLPPSPEPVVATVPALEFVRLLEADIVPTGIAVGACYDWLADPWNGARRGWMGNTESLALSRFWEQVRRRAQSELARDAAAQGNGVLAHVDFGQLIEVEGDRQQPRRYLGRHIVVGTTVDSRRAAVPHEIRPVVDLRDAAPGSSGSERRHQSYDAEQQSEAI